MNTSVCIMCLNIYIYLCVIVLVWSWNLLRDETCSLNCVWDKCHSCP